VFGIYREKKTLVVCMFRIIMFMHNTISYVVLGITMLCQE
jgi:hypothetical protein